VVRARYEYDPYGRRTKVSGNLEADWGFTGHYYHAPSTLHLAWFRAYDANLARWISRDPIQEGDGPNIYTYVGNNPISGVDPLGLWIEDEDGFPILPTGTLLDSLFYDEETKAQHDEIMGNAKDSLKEAGKSLAEEAVLAVCPIGRLGKVGKAANDWGKKHGGDAHWERIKQIADAMKKKDWEDIRINRKQVDAAKNKVGNNRPDISGINPRTGQRHNIEIDTKASSSAKHKATVNANDPNAKNTFITLP
jgi:RHS repeat-associated protein